MDILTTFLLVILVLLILYEIYLRTRPSYRAAKQFPGPQAHPVIGNVLSILFEDQKSMFAVLRNWAQQFKDSYALLFRGGLVVNAIRVKETEVLLSSTHLLEKGIIYNYLKPFLGLGLLNSTGSKWFHRRKILTAAFHFNILPKFLTTFHEECERLVRRLDEAVRQDETVTLQTLAARFALNTICETAMGVKLDTATMADEYRMSIQKVIMTLFERVMNPWLIEDFVYEILGYRAKLDKLLEPVHRFTRNVITKRRELFHSAVKNVDDFSEENIYLNTNQRYALLDTLLASEAKQLIDEEGIREEVDTFMFRGHDTTASAFTFIFLVLANEQAVQQQIFDEIRSVDSDRSDEQTSKFTVNNYNDLKYMDRVIKECLRLYPPVPFISRMVMQDTWFGDRFVPGESMVNVHIFDLHRDPEQFPDPERFDPDRFLPENAEKRNPYAYVPFSAGPRNCIGQRFAMLELKAILTSVLREFRVLPVTKREEIVFIADMILRSRDPIKVKFERRN